MGRGRGNTPHFTVFYSLKGKAAHREVLAWSSQNAVAQCRPFGITQDDIIDVRKVERKRGLSHFMRENKEVKV